MPVVLIETKPMYLGLALYGIVHPILVYRSTVSFSASCSMNCIISPASITCTIPRNRGTSSRHPQTGEVLPCDRELIFGTLKKWLSGG